MPALPRLTVALLAASLAGCAVQASHDSATSGNPAAGHPTGGTNSYCVGGKLTETAGGLSCPWAKTVREACDAIHVSTLPREAVARGPQKGLLCANGERLVYVTTR